MRLNRRFNHRGRRLTQIGRTLLTENGLEWRIFNYEFEQVDDAQSTLEEFIRS